MAASSCWKHCEEEEGENAVIVQFSNGSLKNSDPVDFSLYKNIDKSDPRKRNRRIAVAETDRLLYVGNNFGTGSLKCNTLCKYYVGVLDKKSRSMVVHKAQLFNMQPVIPGELAAEDETLETPSKSFRDKVDSLIEAFGTNKQKRALTSRRMNQVGSDTLQQALAKAANTVIDQKGLEALEQDVAQAEAQADTVPYLPPCHSDADRPEDVYRFDDLLSPLEYEALELPGRKLAGLSIEELQKMEEGGSPATVLRQLQNLPSNEKARERQARCAWYLSQLIKLSHQKQITRKFGQEDGCPRIIQNKLFKSFTVENFNNGRVRNLLSSSMRVKLAAYSLALLLHMGHQVADLTLLYQDLGIPESRMLEVAKSMRLKLTKCAAVDIVGPGQEHRMATLVLPLVKYENPVQRHKRKKMK